MKAIIHQIELAVKHQSSSFGLSLISVSMAYFYILAKMYIKCVELYKCPT